MKKILFLSLLLVSQMLWAQTDILDARTNFGVGETITITGICINGDEMGSSVRYIQDASAGIAVFPGSNWNAFSEPMEGDEVTITGELTEYNGLLEIGPSIESVTINSSGNALPEVQLILASEMGETNEGELIEIDNVQFENAGATIVGNSTYDFTADGQSGTIYIRNGSVLVDTNLPGGLVTLVGICSQFDSSAPYTSGYQLLPRTSADLVLSSSINIIGQVQQGSIEYTTMELFWNTDTPGDSKIEWGLTPALGEEVYNATNTTSHTATITDLEPGTIYYARVSSSNGEDETVSITAAYATRSESSGAIEVYFTKDANTDFATFEEAVSLYSATDDTIAAYISRAEHTIDIAIYNFGDLGIANALNAAYNEGVQIRIVGQGTNTNAAIDDLENGIPVHMREDDFGSGNHNKFMIIDADYVDKAIVLTGSTNWIDQDQFTDFNNIIIFQDQSLARGYRLEFEEMWGSSGPQPDPGNSKFGSEKTVNTPKKYFVGSSPVEVYFSPTDNANQAIINTIQTTDEELNYAVFAATREDIADAIIDEDDLFLTTVRGVLEQTSDPSSIYPYLTDAGMDVYSHEGISGLVHHKYLMVDPQNVNSDPTVLTGSHNWSNSANTINDENTVVVHDARVANLFLQEFMARWGQVGVNESQTNENWSLFPNPTEISFVVNVPLALLPAQLNVYDMNGRLVYSENMNGSVQSVNIENLEAGMYQCELQATGKSLVKKVIVH
jgi:phosphatidylserine/phosphatidylglycerophosphate/cardiolipin synthase-like enzyme